MANSIYDSARAGFATAQYNWLTDNVGYVLVDTNVYTYASTHAAYSAIPVGARIASGTLSSKTVHSSGGLKADNISISALTGAYVGAVVLYKVGGTEAASPLLVYLDTISGLPFAPSGGNVLISWNANGIFKV